MPCVDRLRRNGRVFILIIFTPCGVTDFNWWIKRNTRARDAVFFTPAQTPLRFWSRFNCLKIGRKSNKKGQMMVWIGDLDLPSGWKCYRCVFTQTCCIVETQYNSTHLIHVSSFLKWDAFMAREKLSLYSLGHTVTVEIISFSCAVYYFPFEILLIYR